MYLTKRDLQESLGQGLKKIGLNTSEVPPVDAISAERFSRMRDWTLALQRKVHTGFGEYFITSPQGELHPEDGIIDTDVGYVRVARDHDNQTDVFLYSPNIESLHLRQVEDNGLEINIDPEDPDVYILGALHKDLSGDDKFEVIKEKLNELRRHIAFHEQFYLEAVPIDEEDLDGEWGYRIANKAMAIGMRPLDNGGWRIWGAPNLNSEAAQEADEFVRLPQMPKGKALALFSEGIQDFDNFDDALWRVRELVNGISMRHRRGEPDLVDTEDPDYNRQKLRQLMQWGARQYNAINTRSVRQSLLYGTGIGTAITITQGLQSGDYSNLANNLLSSNAFTAAVEGGKPYFDRAVEKISHIFNQKSYEEQLNEQRDITRRDFSSPYISQDEADNNDNRFLKKADGKAVGELEPLRHRDVDLTPNSLDRHPERVVFPGDQRLKEARLMDMSNRVAGAILFRFTPQTDMMAAYYSNGAIGFRRYRQGLEDTENTVIYRKDENGKIDERVPEDITRGLEADAVMFVNCKWDGADQIALEEEKYHVNPLTIDYDEKMHVADAENEIRRIVADELETARLSESAEEFSNAAKPFSISTQVQLLTDVTREYRRRLHAAEKLKDSEPEAEDNDPQPENT